jgi:ABC-type branched-subunit amino acid transport system substrate-binding protein
VIEDVNEVMAIIGPVGWKESVAVAEKSQELGVVNLNLTAKEGISERGNFLFQNALTPKVQLENLVRFCTQTKKMKRFAILAPDNSFGEDMTNAFWELIKKSGGKVVGYEKYKPDAKDFQTSIRKLTGLEDPRTRDEKELEALTTHVKQHKEKSGKTINPKIPPIIDFDGIFIPDSPKTVAQIAASLTYFDVTGIALLGTAEWNSDLLTKRGGRHVESAIFPGGISLSSKNPRQKEFIRLYAESYGSVPDLLASQAFEAMQIVSSALHKTESTGRADLAKEITNLKDFPTPLGELSFDETRVASRKLPIFGLVPGGSIVEL